MAETTVNSMDDGAADEAMIAFVEAGASADLSDWMHRYPEYSSDFAHAAAERWIGVPYGSSAASDTEMPLTGASETSSVARFKAIGFELATARRVSSVPAAAPLTSLLTAARERGIDAQTLSSRLHVPYSLFVKLHRRLIAPDSLPRALVTQLSEALGRTVDEVAGYLRMPPTLALGASYRADSAPRVGAQESFADALAGDPNATTDQIAFYTASGSQEA